MNAQAFHFPIDFLNLLVDTIPRLCKSKKDVLTFFASAGTNQRLFSDIKNKLEAEPSTVNKYELARTILVRLNEAGDSALGVRREIVKRIVEFEDFSRCWPTDEIAARGYVARVRELQNAKDSLTRLQQNYESQLEEERKKRQSEEQRRLNELNRKRQEREGIRTDLLALYQETNAQKRGKQLESVLNRLFAHESILIRESFEIVGDHQEGVIQQIDGAIEVNSHLYLVEMKWWREPLGPGDISQHMMRVLLRSDARGVFVSASGYTEAAILEIEKALVAKTVVLFTLKELVILLESSNSFESILKSKLEAAQLERKLIFDT